MLRIVASLVAVPLLLVLLLAVAIEPQGGKLGSLTAETFELGPLPIVVMAGLVLVAVFLPLLLLASRFVRVSFFSAAFVGLLSALLPVLLAMWSVLTNPRIRWGARMERLADTYPWLVMGAVGGVLFWLLALYRNGLLDRWVKRP